MDREHGRCRRAARPCSRLRRETPTRRDRTFSTAREYGAPTCQEARTSRSPNLRICCLSWLDVSWSLGWRRPSCFSSRDFHRHSRTGYCESSTKLKLSSFYASTKSRLQINTGFHSNIFRAAALRAALSPIKQQVSLRTPLPAQN